MALASAQALLDELMGRDRNLAPTDKKHNIRLQDSQVCKHYLVKFCPHELFTNTKADLGPCNKLHDNRLKREYESDKRYQQLGYEEDFLRFCQSIIGDVEKKIRRAKQRLALGNLEGGIPTPVALKTNDEKVQVLSERINEMLAKVEQLGCEGKVEEAQGIMKLCDQLKDEREVLQKNSESNHWLQTAEIAAAQEKQMEVCDVCGAFLIVGDAQQRVEDHLMGKQHVGYAMLKAAVDEIAAKQEKEREVRDKQRERDRDDQRRWKSDDIQEERRKRSDDTIRDRPRTGHSSERRHSRSYSDTHRHRSRSRSRDRNYKNSSSKSKDRDRYRHRSSSRDRKHHSHSQRRHSRRSHSRSPDARKDSKYKRSKEGSNHKSTGGSRNSENGDASPKSTEARQENGYSQGDSD